MKVLKTKIIATLSPASLKLTILRDIIAAGADFLRINSAYGNEDQHSTVPNDLKGLKLPEEAKDLPSAVFEHPSAVMLPDETAIGKYLGETVRMMRKIIKEAE